MVFGLVRTKIILRVLCQEVDLSLEEGGREGGGETLSPSPFLSPVCVCVCVCVCVFMYKCVQIGQNECIMKVKEANKCISLKQSN